VATAGGASDGVGLTRLGLGKGAADRVVSGAGGASACVQTARGPGRGGDGDHW
jgi:hypothetical protein